MKPNFTQWTVLVIHHQQGQLQDNFKVVKMCFDAGAWWRVHLYEENVRISLASPMLLLFRIDRAAQQSTGRPAGWEIETLTIPPPKQPFPIAVHFPLRQSPRLQSVLRKALKQIWEKKRDESRQSPRFQPNVGDPSSTTRLRPNAHFFDGAVAPYSHW